MATEGNGFVPGEYSRRTETSVLLLRKYMANPVRGEERLRMREMVGQCAHAHSQGTGMKL